MVSESADALFDPVAAPEVEVERAEGLERVLVEQRSLARVETALVLSEDRVGVGDRGDTTRAERSRDIADVPWTRKKVGNPDE